jgi:integrase
LLLSTLFNHAMDHHRFRQNPARKVRATGTRAEKMASGKARDRKRYLSDHDLARLREAVPARYATLVHLMSRVGLRPGEALALEVGKFDPMRRRLTIDTSVSGFTKTGEARTVTLPAVIGDEIAQHLAQFSDQGEPAALMFPSGAGRMLTVGGFRHTFQRAVKRAGLDEDLTPNDLRHSAVSWAINLGANVYAVQRTVGHAKPSITLDVYGELWNEDADQLAEMMDAALRTQVDRRTTAVATLRG